MINPTEMMRQFEQQDNIIAALRSENERLREVLENDILPLFYLIMSGRKYSCGDHTIYSPQLDCENMRRLADKLSALRSQHSKVSCEGCEYTFPHGPCVGCKRRNSASPAEQKCDHSKLVDGEVCKCGASHRVMVQPVPQDEK